MFLPFVFVVKYVGSLETAVFRILDVAVGVGTFTETGTLAIKNVITYRLVTHSGIVAERQAFEYLKR